MKINELTELTALTVDDNILVQDSPGSSPSTKKITASNFFGATTPIAAAHTTLKLTTGAGAGKIPVSDASGNLTLTSPAYAEMWAYGKSIPFNILVQSVYHALCLVIAGDIVTGSLSLWTFNAGRIVDANITSEANGTGGKLRIVCSGAHSLTTGDLVVIQGSGVSGGDTAHNKPTRITTDGTNPTTEFLCDDISYVGGAGASNSVVVEPAYLKAGASAAGSYLATLTLDGTAASANKAWKWELNSNITANDNVVTERTSTNTLTSMTTAGIVTVVAGDKLWISGKNSTDTSDYTVKNFNLNLVRLA